MRRYNPAIFDALKKLVGNGDRLVQAVQDAGIISDALYFDGLLKIQGNPPEKEHRRIT